ncbi:MAG: geranylgeranyl pyrophosphate synthase, partial [Rhodopseudomonas palustris]|nr:geranylgeranyl pyrophosphate synthase [Rhodopseudomonas palustris]
MTAAVAACAAPAGAPGRRLAGAMRYAVFPGGARAGAPAAVSGSGALGVRRGCIPRAADGGRVPRSSCCTAPRLVHDDLPCFDGADARRGRALGARTTFGEPLAVLDRRRADRARRSRPSRARSGARRGSAARARRTIDRAGAAGVPFGIAAAGQAWECESRVSIWSHYQRAKTGALFVAATDGRSAAGGRRGPGADGARSASGSARPIAGSPTICATPPPTPSVLGKPAGQDI